MPSTFFDSLTGFINDPGKQFLAGAALAGIVWKFFDKVEEKLNDNTKLEIAVWLLGVKVGRKVEPWPETFAKVFDRVFGGKHLSWRCFGRSCLATLVASVICAAGVFVYVRPHGQRRVDVMILSAAVISWIFLFVFDYASLLETRFALHLLRRCSSWYGVLILLLADVVVTGITGVIPSYLVNLGITLHPFETYSQGIAKDYLLEMIWKKNLERQYSNALAGKHERDLKIIKEELAAVDIEIHNVDKRRLFVFEVMWFPAFFTSIWLWLYAGSGFILKAARRFDVGFNWFNSHMDIEKKPLSSIGLVSGVLVALIYWCAALIRHFV